MPPFHLEDVEGKAENVGVGSSGSDLLASVGLGCVEGVVIIGVFLRLHIRNIQMRVERFLQPSRSDGLLTMEPCFL